MVIRAILNDKRLKTGYYALVQIKTVEGSPESSTLLAGDWEYCKREMDKRSPKSTVAEWVSGYELLMMQDLKNRLVNA